MTSPPYLSGHFVWCLFPLTENPVVPGLRHVGYVVAVSGVPDDYSAMIACRTSQPWRGSVLTEGRGILGRTGTPLRQTLEGVLRELFKRRAVSVQILGPPQQPKR